MSFQPPSRRRTLLPTLAALVAVSLTAPAAMSKSAELRSHPPHSSRASAHADRQDLRSPDARDAPRQRANTVAKRPFPGPPTWLQRTQPIAPAPTADPTDGRSGTDWLRVAIAVAGGLLAIGSAGALTRRRIRRPQRTRVAA